MQRYNPIGYEPADLTSDFLIISVKGGRIVLKLLANIAYLAITYILIIVFYALFTGNCLVCLVCY